MMKPTYSRRSLELTVEEYSFEETVRRAREIYAEVDEEEANCTKPSSPLLPWRRCRNGIGKS